MYKLSNLITKKVKRSPRTIKVVNVSACELWESGREGRPATPSQPQIIYVKKTLRKEHSIPITLVSGSPSGHEGRSRGDETE